MAKREVIILSAMSVVVLFAFYIFFIADTSESKNNLISHEEKVNSLTKFAIHINDKINAGKKSDTNIYILENATATWPNDFFLRSETDINVHMASNQASDSEKKEWIYSGYIEMGSKKVAIINGLEYEAGETLNKTEYVVESIMPKSVKLAVKDNLKMVLPLKELTTLSVNKIK